MSYPYIEFTNITKQSILYAQSRTMNISLDNIKYKETIYNRRRLQIQYNLSFVSTITTVAEQNASLQYQNYVNQLTQSFSQGQFQLLVNSIYYQYNVTPDYVIQSITASPPIITIINQPTISPTEEPRKDKMTPSFEGWKIAAIVIFLCVVYILLTLNYYKPYSKIINIRTAIRDRILHFIEEDHEGERVPGIENVENQEVARPTTLYQALINQITPHQTEEIPEIRIRDFNSDDATEILNQLENGKIEQS